MTTFRRQLFLLALLLSTACAGNPVTHSGDSTPAWLTTLIRQSEAEPAANPPAAIVSYQYNGETVYFLTERCCDIMSTVFHADGSIACHPTGGITGSGDGRCVDFVRERRNERIIWRDSRTVP